MVFPPRKRPKQVRSEARQCFSATGVAHYQRDSCFRRNGEKTHDDSVLLPNVFYGLHP